MRKHSKTHDQGELYSPGSSLSPEYPATLSRAFLRWSVLGRRETSTLREQRGPSVELRLRLWANEWLFRQTRGTTIGTQMDYVDWALSTFYHSPLNLMSFLLLPLPLLFLSLEVFSWNAWTCELFTPWKCLDKVSTSIFTEQKGDHMETGNSLDENMEWNKVYKYWRSVYIWAGFSEGCSVEDEAVPSLLTMRRVFALSRPFFFLCWLSLSERRREYLWFWKIFFLPIQSY